MGGGVGVGVGAGVGDTLPEADAVTSNVAVPLPGYALKPTL